MLAAGAMGLSGVLRAASPSVVVLAVRFQRFANTLMRFWTVPTSADSSAARAEQLICWEVRGL